MNDTPAIGHNNPPVETAIPQDMLDKINDFTDAAGAWADKGRLDTVEDSQKATDFVDGARKLWKEVDAARADMKKPHDEAAKAVQDMFRGPLEKIKRAADAVKDLQLAFLRKEADRIAAEKRAEAERIEAERIAAERQLEQARARNDISGIVDAEERAKGLDKAEKQNAKDENARAGSYTGGGRTMAMQKRPKCVIEHKGPALATYRDHPEVVALIERLATAEVRGQKGDKVAPKGFKIEWIESVA